MTDDTRRMVEEAIRLGGVYRVRLAIGEVETVPVNRTVDAAVALVEKERANSQPPAGKRADAKEKADGE